MDRDIPEAVRDRWVSASVQSGAYGWFSSAVHNAMDRHTPGFGCGTHREGNDDSFGTLVFPRVEDQCADFSCRAGP